MKILPKLPPEMTLPISVETYQRLLTASARTKFEKEIWEIGAAAIHDWLARNEPEALTMPIADGYQWKKVFLPNGTLLRTVFDGQNFHCMVEGGQIRYKGEAMSPSGFANVVGGRAPQCLEGHLDTLPKQRQVALGREPALPEGFRAYKWRAVRRK